MMCHLPPLAPELFTLLGIRVIKQLQTSIYNKISVEYIKEIVNSHMVLNTNFALISNQQPLHSYLRNSIRSNRKDKKISISTKIPNISTIILVLNFTIYKHLPLFIRNNIRGKFV